MTDVLYAVAAACFAAGGVVMFFAARDWLRARRRRRALEEALRPMREAIEEIERAIGVALLPTIREFSVTLQRLGEAITTDPDERKPE